ncbi:MAG: ATPase, T2SS/T4P/T4SS family [Acutalibacteraceae bacterium]|nr:ATPase, T2SS/T4P/T4SS family [Acutalibacteraceae bacterium]
MEDKEILEFDRCLYGVAEKTGKILLFMEDDVKRKIQEIRLRVNKPLSVTLRGESLFVSENSRIVKNSAEGYTVSKAEVEESFKRLTGSSVYSHLNEIKHGYVSMRYGGRAGISGTFSSEGAVTHISSLNIRIAREKTGVADKLFKEYTNGGVLIAGKAGSGKTTMLRDFIRQLSNCGKRVAVVDSRGEIGATYQSESYCDLGVNTDVLTGFAKDTGMEMALRTLYPNVIAFDEIGRSEEIEKIKDCLYTGIDVITTAHLGSISELKSNPIISELISTRAVKTLVCLCDIAGDGYKIYKNGEVERLCGL